VPSLLLCQICFSFHHLLDKAALFYITIHISVRRKFVLCIVECERWRHSENVSAENGEFYPLSSVADCMDLCLLISTCVAIDLWSNACSLHLNASNLLSSQATSGVSQYVLDRSCVVSTASTLSLETVFTTPLITTGYCIVFPPFKDVLIMI